jgi:3-dehydroquinate dehydratase-2
MRILVINGPSLNMLGKREVEIYGKETYKDLVKMIKSWSKELNMKVTVKQTNHEGKIIDYILASKRKYDGIVINAGAYTHTSIAILDALKTVSLKTVEVHISNIYEREEFRHFSYIALYAQKAIYGKGFAGYKEALEFLHDELVGE